MNCRHCDTVLKNLILDLGFAPPSNAYLTPDMLNKPEKYFPLRLYACENCWLVQTEDYAGADELFTSEYAYFSSVSSSWVEHARIYSEMITKRLHLSEKSFVIEVASNDGYLLQFFKNFDIPCLGIEPTGSTANACEAKGINVIRDFFGEKLGSEFANNQNNADLIIANNVLAHVPDINDFVTGFKKTLKPHGTITVEFPHLINLIKGVQFDTVYHEHYSYLSLSAVSRIFLSKGLKIYDIDQLKTHGGSLRVYATHIENNAILIDNKVNDILQKEKEAGLQDISGFSDFQSKTNIIKNNLLEFLLSKTKEGKKIIGYGAAAKGNTLLNYAGIKPDLIPFICDAAPSKQGKYLPGSHIPICHPEKIRKYKPDYVIILPWNISQEIISELGYIREWGGQFVTAVPELKIGIVNL